MFLHLLKKQMHTLGVFLFFISVFIVLHFLLGGFLGTDVLYHITHVKYIAFEGSSYITYDWFPTHLFALHSVNPYLLHHSLLAIWFILFGNSMLSFTLFASIVSSFVFTVFYTILRYYRLPYSFLLTFFTSIMSTGFLFRLMLDRPFSIGIFCFFLGTILLIEKKYKSTALLTMLYILSYNLAVFLILPAIVVVFVRGIIAKVWSLQPLIATLGGLLLGLLVHPQTFSYIILIKAHLYDIFILQLQGVPLPVGAEIVPVLSTGFATLHIVPMLLWVFAIIAFAITYHRRYREENTRLLTLGALSICWFPITLAVHRGLEYWYLITILFSYLVLIPIWAEWYKRKIHNNIFKIIPITAGLCMFLVFGGSLALFVSDANRLSLENAKRISDAQEVITHLPPEGTIWFGQWYDFPYIFSSAPIPSSYIYTMAFDPVFLYLYNTDLYYSWYMLMNEGKACFSRTDCPEALTSTHIISNLFNANIAILPNDQTLFSKEQTIFTNDSFSLLLVN